MTKERATKEWAEVIDFWFDPENEPFWFKKSDAFDEKVRTVMGPWLEKARKGDLATWQEEPEGALALVLLLDQAPRNLFRGCGEAYACDAMALEAAKKLVDRGFDQSLTMHQKIFAYLPFEHSEELSEQQRCLKLMGALPDQSYLEYAQKHLDIVARFGRFPHRNAALGRQSTAEELAFLKEPGSSF